MSAGYATADTRFYGDGRIKTKVDLSASSGLWGKLDSGEIDIADVADEGIGIITDGGSGVGSYGALGYKRCWAISGAALAVGVKVTNAVTTGKTIAATTGQTPKAEVVRGCSAADEKVLLEVYGDDVAQAVP